jgi:hypothetical protein
MFHHGLSDARLFIWWILHYRPTFTEAGRVSERPQRRHCANVVRMALTTRIACAIRTTSRRRSLLCTFGMFKETISSTPSVAKHTHKRAHESTLLWYYSNYPGERNGMLGFGSMFPESWCSCGIKRVQRRWRLFSP